MHPFTTCAVVCACLGLAGLVLPAFVRLGGVARQWLARPAALWVVLVVVGLGTLVAQVVALERDVAGEFTLEEIQKLPELHSILLPVESQWAVTDAGTTVPLFTLPSEAAQPFLAADTTYWTEHALVESLLRTDGPDARYNCHGWVFTGGRCWVRGPVVERILSDNGYQAVTDPRPGDIIVYRDNTTHSIAHTGLVRTQAADTGLVLIESKMGALGRFIHPPEKHGYTNTTGTYYRTGRGAHLLRGLDGTRRAGGYVAARSATF